VKRGVRTNVEMGAPLVEGRRYRLVVDTAWRDAAGAPLAAGYEKRFAVAPFDDRSPDPARWALHAPRAGTRTPLRIDFGEPLDHALAARMISVAGPGGAALDGVVELVREDRAWSFAPREPWGDGEHELRVAAALEDVAGNSVARPFDADRRGGGPSAEESGAAGPLRVVRFRPEPAHSARTAR
jgi:hypothetical protein